MILFIHEKDYIFAPLFVISGKIGSLLNCDITNISNYIKNGFN